MQRHFVLSSMASQEKALANLQQYVSRLKDLSNIEAISPDEEEVYANRLIKSLQSLQNQVKEHEAALEKVRTLVPASPSSLG